MHRSTRVSKIPDPDGELVQTSWRSIARFVYHVFALPQVRRNARYPEPTFQTDPGKIRKARCLLSCPLTGVLLVRGYWKTIGVEVARQDWI